MRMGYFYLFTGTACVSVLGILHKLAEVKKCRSSAINVLLFSFSFLIIVLYMIFISTPMFELHSRSVGWPLFSA